VIGSSESVGDRFAAFYAELHGGESAYLWQRRMAERLVAEGPTWDWLIAPTGAGKTTLIECFVFALSEQLAHGDRRIPLRLFWVIDRRGVVDQVFAGAVRLAEQLEHPAPGTPAHSVAENLRSTIPPGRAVRTPLDVRLWRGGDGPRIEPLPLAAPCVVCSTVDQVGSRLLFRGYGTSFKSRPIDAALVGTDSLVVLDEAHLAGPFAATVRAVRQEQERAPCQPVPMLLRVMQVSATPRERPTSGESFTLTREELAEEPLAQRLRASKPTRLVEGKRTQSLADTLATEAVNLAGASQRVIGVVTNLVQDARDTFEQLRCRQGAEAKLLIGPSRPLDREAVLTEIPDRQARHALSRTLYVVGTQTLEVGLDLDFDGLVTVCAPFASLVQRLGRLDRAGYVTRDQGSAPAVIVRPPKGCPIYGEALEETWAWLKGNAQNGELNLGPAHLDGYRASSEPPPPAPPGPQAPVLAPWHVEALVQTSRDPLPTPEVGFFLHGEEGAQAPDVSLVWRSDITESNRGEWEERVRARPPHRGEMLTLPVAKVRGWLSGSARDARFSDIESGAFEITPVSHAPIAFARVDPPGPDDEWALTLLDIDHVNDVRPGDVVVVPSTSGGCDEFGWAPSARDEVSDLGDLNRQRPRVLLGPQATALDLVPQAIRTMVGDLIAELLDDTTDCREAYTRLVPDVITWLRGLDCYEPVREHMIDRLESEPGEVALLPSDAPDSLVVIPRAQRRSATLVAQAYCEHVERVEELTVAYACSQNVADQLVRTLRMAARYHDAGKLDHRFQAWLNRGIRPDPAEPLAKSGYSPRSRRSESYRLLAGWPRGKRHEIVSAVLVEQALRAGAFENADGGVDVELLRYLPAVHHGQMRPFLPMFRDGARRLIGSEEPDPNPVTVKAKVEDKLVSVSSSQDLDFLDHANRFLELNERYGPWGLAALEATLVLADRAASAEVG
jgi:CRISPR-associated endonuclease/helicase Cas3